MEKKYKLLHILNSPKSSVGREATFKEGKMELRVKNNKLIEVLSLSLIQQKSKQEELLEIEEILNQVYLGVWVSEIPGKAKNALPVKVEKGGPARLE